VGEVGALKLYVSPDRCEWVIAESKEDAWNAWAESLGFPNAGAGAGEDEEYWLAIHDEEKLTIWCNNETGLPTMDDDDSSDVELTAIEWVKRCGRGWLCTTEE
jgi:hypothetical protein